MNIVLVGFMGVGKTTYGKALAQKLGYRFVDTDQCVEERFGKKVAQIFDDHGEEEFRKHEREIVLELAKKKEQIISCGGGVITHKPSVDALKETGLVIGLIMAPEILLKRLKQKPEKRPLIRGKTDEEIIQFYMSRLPHHFLCHANVELHTENKEKIMEQLYALIRRKAPNILQ